MFDSQVTASVYDAKRILITSADAFRDKDLIAMVPGSKYDLHEHRWLAPLTWPTCLALRGVFKDRLVLDQTLIDWATKERAERIDPAMALREVMVADGDDDLYPFQRAGVRFLAYAKQALLCDEMGSGKTIQAIRTLTQLTREGHNPFPAIVVAPNSMVLTWVAEFKKWWPDLVVLPLRGSMNECRKILQKPAHVYVINWEKLRGMSRLAGYGSIRLKRCVECEATLPAIASNSRSRCERCPKELNERTWVTVIADEVHKMKDPRAKQTRACWALRTPSTKFVFALTGTAIANAPHDLWPALHLLSPEEHPSRQRYIDRFCLLSYNPFGPMTVIGLKPETKEEFFGSVDPRMRRMPKEAVLPYLPKKIYTERYVDMTTKQARAYKQMEDDLIAMLDDGVTVAVNPLTQLTRLSQFASAYAEMDDEGKVRLTEPSSKIDGLVDLLEELGDEPAVVFAQSRQLIELAATRLEKLGISYTKIVGGLTQDQREWSKNEFQRGAFRVILCTIAAGGIGVTLTRAGTAIFLQRSWSMVDNAQAEDRVHRIGSEIHDKIQIIDIISNGTMEERQRLVLGNKLDRLEEIMRDRETLKKLLGGKS